MSHELKICKLVFRMLLNTFPLKTEYNNNNNNEKNQPVLIYFKNRRYFTLIPEVFSRTNHLLTKDPAERIIGKGIKKFSLRN